MSKTSKILLGAVILIAVVVLFAYYLNMERVAAGVSNKVRDLVGTMVGTTTTGVYLVSTATTSYPVWIGGDIDIATFTFKPTIASTSATISAWIVGSNDSFCNTATTTSSLLATTTANINWFDVGFHAKGMVSVANISTATTTFSWALTGANVNKQITLTDLNYECLSLQISGTSTYVHVQVKTKQY